ncbi:GMC oxidoreductase [Neolentinus lepideus HHB14362 ss-1]|uniref:GMC oxidoreductase n=1 Tax=Neolentinus lepideus HHB14362 ss-1 TaxID=1314782 RepID=A0A165P4H1_9AGAM|nr:GMC oxidoreductase [Neolentinus lepideus HHB14362 ss-1]
MILDAQDFASTPFDYIIVGGGLCGLVVAARLSEDPDVKVGVIEAGQYLAGAPELLVPGMAGAAVMNPKFDWCFTTVPQRGANNRVISQPRGKVLGGSSATNFLVTGRASSGEYDALEQMGNTGWNWEEMLKYFKKAETFHFPDPKLAQECQLGCESDYHGSKGPIHSTHPPHVWDLYHPTQKAFETFGISVNPDPDTGLNTGFVFTTSCVDPTTATRSFSTTGYYEPNAHRLNLAVTTGAHAAKIIFSENRSPLVATGVEYINDGKTYNVSAKREVIISAGTMKTPQFLELSGIGKKDILSKYNITQLLELPVGENFQDHCYVRTTIQVAGHHVTADKFFDPTFVAQEMELYQKSQSGGFSRSTHTAYSYLPLSSFMTQNDMKVVLTRAEDELAGNISPSLLKQYELYKSWLADSSKAQLELFMHPALVPGDGNDLAPAPDICHMTFLSVLLHPFSRGSAHIQSADPLAAPAIDPGYLSNPVDLDILARAVLFARKLAQTDSLKDEVVKILRPDLSLESVDDIKEYCKNALSPIYHPVGTAAMLPRDDGGVVDSHLRVYGTANVRVVDASVLPVELSAHLQSTLYGLAEKAADLIKL